jgi:uncharacterized protein (TIGR02421 family)
MAEPARIPIEDPLEIDGELVRLGSDILPMRFLEPLNGEEERARFMSTPGYNPQFAYHAIPDTEYALLRERLEALVPDDSPVGQLFERTRGYLLRRLKLRQVIGTSKFWDPDLYGPPSEDLIAIAEQILEARPPVEHVTDSIHTADRLVAMCEQALRQYGLGEWRVIARPHISSSNVESANRLIIVRADQLYSMTSIKRLIVHEIETHVLRAANGYLQPLRIFGAAVIPGYLTTEEGLALVNEERAGYIDHSRLRVLAARVVAAHLARLTSFREIYDRLIRSGLSENEAWTTVKRVKRGLGDTSVPGGYIKDHVYLWGKIKLEQFLVDGGDLAGLYVGKIGLEMLHLVQALGMRPAKYLPRSYRAR